MKKNYRLRRSTRLTHMVYNAAAETGRRNGGSRAPRREKKQGNSFAGNTFLRLGKRRLRTLPPGTGEGLRLR